MDENKSITSNEDDEDKEISVQDEIFNEDLAAQREDKVKMIVAAPHKKRKKRSFTAASFITTCI